MDEFITWILAIIVVMLIMIGVAAIVGKMTPNPLITECEEQLPRDKHCKLIAVPIEEKLDD